MTNNQTILYVGGFVLPDKNAAAQRVIGIGKALRERGYNVVFLGKIEEESESTVSKRLGFECKNVDVSSQLVGQAKELFGIEYIKNYIEKSEDNISAIIAYNYPAIALLRLKKYCKKKGIKCIGDITEWYVTKSGSLPYRIAKNIDSGLRMRFVNKKLDGLIVISNYLEDYYKELVPTINIPPLVDKTDKKWITKKENHKGTIIVYAGSPSATKEKLDYIVRIVNKVYKSRNIELHVIGITKDQFIAMYPDYHEGYEGTTFFGRVSHQEAIISIIRADYSILIRDNNLVNRAGFPTKFVESISAGTPVIANDNSNVADYLKDSRNGMLVTINGLEEAMVDISMGQMKIDVDDNTFHYGRYVEKLNVFLIDRLKVKSNETQDS